MTPKRNALGRGLDSLISFGDIRTDGSSAIREINIDLISPNPDQPRTTFDDESLDELATSIRELGIIQPLSLRAADGDRFQIIAGERRWRAAKRAGLASVPAYVRTASDSETTEMALIENIQREDLNAIEVALAFRKLIDTYNLTQERLSERLGKKRATIANHLRLLRLPAEIQLGLRDKKVDMGHARAILSVNDPKQQLRLYNICVKDGLSVRRVEELAKEWSEALERGEKPMRKPSRKPSAASSALYDSFRKELSNYFPTPVKFSRSDDGHGSITLRFSDDDELLKLVQLFEKLK
ncbi:MAG: ParB/RepB/Spo0J family partition protein [Prevotella sp.]|nr:ParB/RepB/Spo0J family partition protein [Bacteroides sp.]MCM1365766.1 ParB/RepB/Spo0J family partition protein [Prevotella sp.]MCM1436436.1 ParB/RepB/Spo0J family partition protein [Prevotella sp.]